MNAVARSLAIGLAAGAAGSLTMDLFARAVRGDRQGHGVQPPQADGGEDAPERVGRVAYETLAGAVPPADTRQRLGVAAHYAFGATLGGLYALVAHQFPGIRQGRGLAYGALVWAFADEGLMPGLGLSRGPRQLPPRVHLYAFAGHLAYGLTVDTFAGLQGLDRRAQ